MLSARTIRSFSALSLALALSAWPTLAQDTSKLELGPLLNINGGWEDGKGGYYFTKPTLSFIDNDEVYRGQASLRLQGENGADKTEANIAVQGFKIPPPGPNTQYLMRIAVKAKNVDPKFPPSVQFRREDGAKHVTVMGVEQTMIRQDFDWKTFEVVSGPLPADTTTLSFWLHQPAQSKATLWFDAIEVRQILNPPPAVAPPVAPVAPVAAPVAPPKPAAAAAPATAPKPIEKSASGWNLELNHNNLSIYERGEVATATLKWQGEGAAPTLPAFALYNHLDTKLRDLPARGVGGQWEIALPTDTLGYYEIRPQGAGTEGVIAAQGSRPAGKATFAVVDKINPNPSRDFTTGFLSSQGTTILGQRDGQNYGWNMLPYLGVQAQGVGYQWGNWEADGPGTFEKNIANDRQPKWVRDLKIVPYFHLNSIPIWAADTSRLPEKERSGKSTQRVPPRDWAQWEAYLEKIVPYIVKNYDYLPQRTYEVMWEPVIPWGWYGTPEEIVKTFEIANRVVHKYDPKGRIAGPTLSGLNDTTYYETLLKAGLGPYLDVVAFHPYKGYPPEKNAIPESLRNIHELTKKYAGRDLPFIGTEFGFPEHTTGSALNQGYGLTTSILIFKGEGARQHTLFYMADYAGEPGYGMNYNLLPGLPFGTSKISPKPGVPMIRAAIDQVGNSEPVGKLDYFGSDIWGYVFKDNTSGNLLAALWDASDRDRTIQFDTGVAKVDLVDSFGNSQSTATKDGVLPLQLRRSPVYVRGISPQLYGTGRIASLLQAPDVWKVYRGQNATLPVGFSRNLGGTNAVLTFDTDATVSSSQLRQPVQVRQGGNTTLSIAVEPTAPLGPVAGSLRIREGDNILYRGVQRIEVAPELQFDTPQTRRVGGQWQAVTTVKNLAPFTWSGNATLTADGEAPRTQALELPAGASREITFPVAPREASQRLTTKLQFQAKSGSVLSRDAKLSFFEIPKRPAAPDFWAKLPAVALHATEATVWKQHPSSTFKGDADLSAQVSAAHDADNLYVQVIARDDIHRQVASVGTTWSQDSLQLAFDIMPERGENTNLLAEGFERTRSEWTCAFSERGAEIYLSTAPGGSLVPESSVVRFPGAKLEGGRQGDQTIYRLTLPWKMLDPRGLRDPKRLGIAAALNDSDHDTAFGDRRGIELFGGILRSKNPEDFGIAQLLP